MIMHSIHEAKRIQCETQSQRIQQRKSLPEIRITGLGEVTVLR
jgi:hypothetical protein